MPNKPKKNKGVRDKGFLMTNFELTKEELKELGLVKVRWNLYRPRNKTTK